MVMVGGQGGRALSSKVGRALFDATAKAAQKARAASAADAARYDYLRDHIGTQLVDRLQDVSRKFPRTVDLFCGSGHFLRAVRAAGSGDGQVALGIERLIHTDVHKAMLTRAEMLFDEDDIPKCSAHVVAPGEKLPVEDGSVDAVVSGGGLHWVSDLRGQMTAIRAALRDDGVFIAAMFGGDSLHELRVSLQTAEMEKKGQVTPRVSPMVRLADAAALLGASGLSLPTADVERVVMRFDDMWSVMRHVRAMGESNALTAREGFVGREVLHRAAQIYDEQFGEVGEDGKRCVPVTLEIMHMIGWKPAASQPRALQRGSAQASLANLAPEHASS